MYKRVLIKKKKKTICVNETFKIQLLFKLINFQFYTWYAAHINGKIFLGIGMCTKCCRKYLIYYYSSRNSD